jgi:hypothetical protein
MAAAGLLRVVVARRGKVKAAEFRLRPGEAGLSLFRHADSPGPAEVIAAVRAAGKTGELAIAEVPVAVLVELGLRLVPTPGGTPDAAVNALHLEARPPRWRKVFLWLRRRPVHEWFNEVVVPQIATTATLLPEEG